MLGFGMLLLVSIASAFAIIWLITYAPIAKKTLGIKWSPRLFICRWLVPFDIFMTTIMVLGPWIVGAGGVSHMVLATFTSLGLTAGIVFIRKIFIPKWQIAFKQEVINTTPIRL